MPRVLKAKATPVEEPEPKLAEKKKPARKAIKSKLESTEENSKLPNGVVEDVKPKGGRAKKATKKETDVTNAGEKTEAPVPRAKRGSKKVEEVVVEPISSAAVKARPKRKEQSAEPVVKAIEKNAVVPKATAKRGSKNVEEVVAEPSSSAVGKGRPKRKEQSAEPVAEAIEKKAVRGKKRAAEEPNPAPAVSSKAAKAETVVTTKKKTTKAADNKLEKAKTDRVKQTPTEKATVKVTARKRVATKTSNDVDDEQSEPKPSKVKKTLLNPTETMYNKADFELTDADNNSSNVSNSSVERKQLKISSWNVAGLRSWLKKDGLKFLEYEDPDIFCMQEIKCTIDQMPDEVKRIPGYHPYWLCLPGGYAGVALYSKIMPINVEYGIGNAAFDDAGRLITAEYEKFFLLNVYVPNSGRKLVNLEARMRWEKLFQEHVKKLDARKAVIICGDMNVSHTEIDLANPKSNTRSAGFTVEEREKMTELLSLGFLDTFRQLYPKKIGAYTYWTYMSNARSRNVGWRLDYFLISERIGKRVIENAIRSQVMGSDHCPITLFINI